MSLDLNQAEEKPNPEMEESDNLYEDWLKSCSNDSPDRAGSIQTIVVKSVAQSYQGLFQNLTLESVVESREKLRAENASSKTTSPGMSFASPREKFGSLLGFRDLNKTCYASILEQQQESDKEEELSKVFCTGCGKHVFPSVSVRLKELNLWSSIKYFVESLKCCSTNLDLKEYHEYAYTCSVCAVLIMHRPIMNK
jgi:hypothetical protein